MSIPTKIIIHGDKVAGGAFIGDGHRLMATLENLMEFQGLEQYVIQTSPFPGALITAKKEFGMRTMDIYVPGGDQRVEEEKKRKCICFPHLSFGIITKVTPALPIPDDYETPELYDAAVVSYRYYLEVLWREFRYEVLVCTGKSFVLVEEVFAPGWEVYFKGQYVMVSIGKGLPGFPVYDCDRMCLMEEPRFPTLVITPFHLSGKMRKWFKI